MNADGNEETDVEASKRNTYYHELSWSERQEWYKYYRGPLFPILVFLSMGTIFCIGFFNFIHKYRVYLIPIIGGYLMYALFCYYYFRKRRMNDRDRDDGVRTPLNPDPKNPKNPKKESRMMQIIVATLLGKQFIIELETYDRIIDLKMKLEQLENIPVDTQRIIFHGKNLSDDSTLKMNHLRNKSKVTLIIDVPTKTTSGDDPE